MYKLTLCLRYLRTRWIALASIVSVTLGVATLIVVNAVMSGFSGHVKERLHGILADVMVESVSSDGVDDPQRLMRIIDEAAGEHIAAMTPTVEIYGMMSFDFQGKSVPQPVTLVGILPDGKDMVSPIRQFLLSRTPPPEEELAAQLGRFPIDEELGWNLTPQAESVREYTVRWLNDYAGQTGQVDETVAQTAGIDADDPFGDGIGSAGDDAEGPDIGEHFFSEPAAVADPFAMADARVYVGAGLVSQLVPSEDGESRTRLFVAPGQDVTLSTVKAGVPEPVRFRATVCDIFKSGFSEYDANLVFCNLEMLQAARGMLVRSPGQQPDWRDGSVTAIQIRLKDYAESEAAIAKIEAALLNTPLSKDAATGQSLYQALRVATWEHKQAALLNAVAVETSILNVLLALIICVAGFGILAIFYMIVAEKTRDIGILKALGAGSTGVMSVFLGYGFTLGLVGAGGGVALGLLIVRYINEIEDGLSWLAGAKVFDEQIYYFSEIPTAISPTTVAVVAAGSVLVAVLASVLPAWRAAS